MVAFKIMLAACFTVAGCYGAGVIALRWSRAKLDRLERVPLTFVCGAACLHLAIFAVMAAGIAYKPVLAGLLAAAIVGGFLLREKSVPQSRGGTQKADWIPRILFAPIFGTYTVLYIVNAWVPDTSADGAGYHLANLAYYLRAHGFVRIPTNMYSDLGQGVEMVYAPAFAFGRHSGPALVHVAFLIALAMMMYAFGRRLGKPWVGAAAAAIVFVAPVLGRDATTAYIDVAGAAIVFAAFYWLQIWDEQRDARLLVIAGFMAGYAFAAKYTLAVVGLYALGFVVWRARRIRPAITLAAAAAVMAAPWLIKNWILVQNPIAPFATRLFPSPYFHTMVIEEWAAYLRRYDVANLWTLPWEDTVRGLQTQGFLGPIFLLAPLALFALRDRMGRRLLLAAAMLFATYFENVGTRFLIPCLPFVALAMMLALEKWRPAMGVVALLAAVGSWITVMPLYAHRYSWRLNEFPYEAALRMIPEDQYIRKKMQYDILRLIEEKTAPGDRVFCMVGLEGSYTSRDIFELYEGAENNLLFDFLNIARIEDYKPSRVLIFRLREQRADLIRLVETARGEGSQLWNVHELRFYHHGVEIPRTSAWRLRAWPNLFEIQLAFDNSLATRWRTWRTAEPGMYLEVNFGRTEDVDEVRMWTSHDWLWPIQFRVETGAETAGGGEWRAATDRYEEIEQKPGPLGPAAMTELYAHGIRYLVVPDTDQSADEFADSPESWKLEMVGRANNASLYRLVP